MRPGNVKHLHKPFIALEGGEGCGKTTQLELLKARLPKRFPNLQFYFTREPGGSPYAEKIRELILDSSAASASGITMLGLFLAARFDHIENTVAPKLAEGAVVITDRFAASSYAYQVKAMGGRGVETLFDDHYNALGEFVPALTIILDIDPVVAQKRVQERGGQKATHFDSRPIEFHQTLRKGYLEYAMHVARTTSIVIDANRPPEQVHQDIVEYMKSRVIADMMSV